MRDGAPLTPGFPSLICEISSRRAQEPQEGRSLVHDGYFQNLPQRLPQRRLLGWMYAGRAAAWQSVASRRQKPQAERGHGNQSKGNVGRSNQGDFQKDVVLELSWEESSCQGCEKGGLCADESLETGTAWSLRINVAGVGEGRGKMVGKVGGAVRVTAGPADLEGHRSRFCLVLPAEESPRLGRGE